MRYFNISRSGMVEFLEHTDDEVSINFLDRGYHLYRCVRRWGKNEVRYFYRSGIKGKFP